jgi:chaperonin GroEL
MDLKRGIDKAVRAVVESLRAQSQTVGNDNTKIEQVATISAIRQRNRKTDCPGNGKSFQDGVITIEEAKGIETTVDVVEGMQFDRGIFRRISLLTAKKWKPSWTIPTFLSMIRK